MYAWLDLGNGRQVYRKLRTPHGGRSDLPSPRIVRDGFDRPVQSMANGRWYDSKRGLSASHRASGNPHGQDFIELGNEEPKFVPYETDKAELVSDIKEAMADVKAGRLPDVLTLDD